MPISRTAKGAVIVTIYVVINCFIYLMFDYHPLVIYKLLLVKKNVCDVLLYKLTNFLTQCQVFVKINFYYL